MRSPCGFMKTNYLDFVCTKHLYGKDVRGNNSDGIHATSREKNKPFGIRSGIVDTEKLFSPPIPIKPLFPHVGVACSVHYHVCSCSWPLCTNMRPSHRCTARKLLDSGPSAFERAAE